MHPRHPRRSRSIAWLAGLLSGALPMIGVPLSLLHWIWTSPPPSSWSVPWTRVLVQSLAVSLYAFAIGVLHGSSIPAITYVNLALPILALPIAVGLLGSRDPDADRGPAFAPWYSGIAVSLVLVAILASVEFAVAGRARLLSDHPNLLAHASVLVGTTVLLGGSRMTRTVGWGSVLLIAVFAGSRTAMLAWGIGSIAYLLRADSRWRVHSVIRRGLPIALAGATLIVLFTLPRWTSAWYAVFPPSNLLVDTEDLTRSTWRSRGLTVKPRGDDAPRAFEIARDDGPAWQRLQQDLWLGPGRVSVTVHGVVSNDSETTPTFSIRTASATVSEGAERFALSIRSGSDMGVAVSNGAATHVQSVSAEETDGGTALRATVDLALPVATLFTFGVSPSHVEGPGAATVHSLMVTTRRLQNYVPGIDNEWLAGRMAVVQRLVFYQTASSLILERPWFGWGTVNIRSSVASARTQVDPRLEGYPLAHAHNALLQIALTFGFSGLALICVITAASLPRASNVLVPMLVLAALQTLDFTLLNGAVLWAGALAVALAAILRTRPDDPTHPR